MSLARFESAGLSVPARVSPRGRRPRRQKSGEEDIPDAVARLLFEVVYFAHAIHWSRNSFHTGLDLQSQEL